MERKSEDVSNATTQPENAPRVNFTTFLQILSNRGTMTQFPDLKEIDKESALALSAQPNITVERKRDGTAAMATISHKEVTIQGRGLLKDGTYQDYTSKFPEITDALSFNIKTDCKLLGELVVMKPDGINEDFQLIQTRLTRKQDIIEYACKYPADFIVFDICELEGKDVTHLPYSERRKLLLSIFTFIDPALYLMSQYTHLDLKPIQFELAEEYRWEGLVLKDLNSPWGVNQHKYKLKRTYDVYTYGEIAKKGEGKNSGLVGSVTCYQIINSIETPVGNVGGGFDVETRISITNQILDGSISRSKPAVWEIQSHEILKSGKFRFPNYIRTRTDKAPSQCTRTCPNFTPEQPSKPTIPKTLDDWM